MSCRVAQNDACVGSQIAFEAADVEADRAAQRALARRAAGGRQLPEIEELEDNRFPEF